MVGSNLASSEVMRGSIAGMNDSVGRIGIGDAGEEKGYQRESAIWNVSEEDILRIIKEADALLSVSFAIFVCG
jgi:hypothetical protein